MKWRGMLKTMRMTLSPYASLTGFALDFIRLDDSVSVVQRGFLPLFP